MTRPLHAALPALLLLASPAFGQSSLGQAGSLPPPRAAAPAPPAAPAATAPAAAEKPRPKPPAKAAEKPAERRGEKTAEKPPEKPAEKPTEKPLARATPTLQPRPGVSNSAKPASPAAAARRKPAPAAAAAAAGIAAGAVAGAAVPPPPAPAAPSRPSVGPATGLPLPRFAALGSNQVNLRIGPDLRYKIEWTYQRKDLPVQIVEEHEHWRRIRDPEGTEGWVQRPLLTSRRSFLVQGEERALRSRPEANAEPVARLKPGVIGMIRHCEAESAWCEARVGDYRGWIRRSEIWGVAPDEAIN